MRPEAARIKVTRCVRSLRRTQVSTSTHTLARPLWQGAETGLQGARGCVGTGQEAVQSAQRGTVVARTEVLAAGEY